MSSGTAKRSVRARRALLLAAGLVALAAPAVAQDTAGPPASQASAPVDPERLALAREYVRESHIDAAMRGMFANMAKSMPRMSADSATDAKARQFMSSFSIGMDAAVPMLVDATTEVTARVFTTQELKDLVAFYGSPAGQSMVAKMPMLMQQVTPLVFQILPKVYGIAEADYCSHQTCTEADHTRFQRMQSSLRSSAPPPPGGQ
jgi:uncharacterized protein